MEVKELYEYPVKGLKGSRVSCASVNSRGLNLDRRLMLVDSSNSFLSQRQIPGLVKLLPTLDDEIKIENLDTNKYISTMIEKFVIRDQVEIWGQIVEAEQAPDEINDWISDQVGQKVKLFHMGDKTRRPVPGGNEGDIVSFADGYPILLTGSASLDDLNSRLANPVSIDRFRTNIHVSTNKPFEEESWQKIKIGDVILRVAKKCARCKVINVDQNSGKVYTEPLEALRSYRQEDNKVNFGMNLIPETHGLIHEGDRVEVLA